MGSEKKSPISSSRMANLNQANNISSSNNNNNISSNNNNKERSSYNDYSLVNNSMDIGKS